MLIGTFITTIVAYELISLNLKKKPVVDSVPKVSKTSDTLSKAQQDYLDSAPASYFQPVLSGQDPNALIYAVGGDSFVTAPVFNTNPFSFFNVQNAAPPSINLPSAGVLEFAVVYDSVNSEVGVGRVVNLPNRTAVPETIAVAKNAPVYKNSGAGSLTVLHGGGDFTSKRPAYPY